MIIDFHTHIFSNDICVNRYDYLDDDHFRNIYSNPHAQLIDHVTLLNEMEKSSLDFAVAMGFPWQNQEFCSLQNEYFENIIDLSQGTIIPFGSIPINAAVDVEWWVNDIKKRGLRGVGEVSFYRDGLSAANLDFLRRLLAAVQKHELPLCIHVNEPVGHMYPGKYEPSLHLLYSTVSEYPCATVIFSHWGGGLLFYELMPEVSKALVNCYYDTAASPLIYHDSIYAVAQNIISHKKILFGSDFPLIGTDRYRTAIDHHITDVAVKADILGGNAARLLNI